VASSGAAALDAVRTSNPGAVLLDVDLGDTDGIALTRYLRAEYPWVRVLVVTCHDDEATVVEALRAGADGFVAKDADVRELLDAVRAVRRGDLWVQPRLLRGVVASLLAGGPPRSPDQERLARLTDRELDVLRAMVEGLDRSMIARRLFLSTNTVRTHTRNLFKKLGVHSGVEAVSLALRAGVAPSSRAAGLAHASVDAPATVRPGAGTSPWPTA
jgi:DNA-binding NarL/FixJ family response regulator